MIKSLIKEYKRNNIFDLIVIKKELDKNLKFIQKDKKIFNINNMLVFKRNMLSDNIINAFNLDDKYKGNIYHSIDIEDGLNWLFIKEISEYKEKNPNGNKKSESEHILTTNKLSIEISKRSDINFLEGQNPLIKKEILTIIENLKFSLVEIPNNYKLFELLKFFRKIDEVISSLELNYSDIQLRLKKIKKYKKEGMFINKNLIIIDPRNPFIFFHELGHFIYENKLDFTLNGNRFLASNNERIANDNKNRFDLNQYKKLENYDISSEIFANWFEESVDVILG